MDDVCEWHIEASSTLTAEYMTVINHLLNTNINHSTSNQLAQIHTSLSVTTSSSKTTTMSGNTANQAPTYVTITLHALHVGHSACTNTPIRGSKDTNQAPAAFDAKGAIGGAFTKDGAIGSIGEQVGGPLASDGAIGKNFNPDGSIGGTVQNALGGEKK